MNPAQTSIAKSDRAGLRTSRPHSLHWRFSHAPLRRAFGMMAKGCGRCESYFIAESYYRSNLSQRPKQNRFRGTMVGAGLTLLAHQRIRRIADQPPATDGSTYRCARGGPGVEMRGAGLHRLLPRAGRRTNPRQLPKGHQPTPRQGYAAWLVPPFRGIATVCPKSWTHASVGLLQQCSDPGIGSELLGKSKPVTYIEKRRVWPTYPKTAGESTCLGVRNTRIRNAAFKPTARSIYACPKKTRSPTNNPRPGLAWRAVTGLLTGFSRSWPNPKVYDGPAEGNFAPCGEGT